MSSPDVIQLEVDKCSKCGQCLAVCPTYIETRDEVQVARGRIALFDAVLAQRLPYTGGVAEAAQSCLACLRCAYVCPNDVQFDRLITELKRRMPRAAALSWWNKLVFRRVLPRRQLMDALVRVAAALQRILPRGHGMTRHLPLLFKGGRRLPELSKQPALRKHGTDRKPPAGSTRTVYLFTGCMINYAYAEVADSVVNVLRHFGYDVIVPRGQVCCGTPVLSLGDVEQVKALARANMREMPGDAPILVACASCGETFKKVYRDLLGAEVEPFASRVYDFAEFLDHFVDFPSVGLSTRVVYHDPCHLRFGQRITQEPRRLLRAAAHYEEAEGADYCCGMGGLFSMHHYGLAQKIARRKSEAMRAVEAELVTTECPGCVLQLRDRLAADGVPLRVVHIAQLLEQALVSRERAKP